MLDPGRILKWIALASSCLARVPLSGCMCKMVLAIINESECTPSQRPRTSLILHGFCPGSDQHIVGKAVSSLQAIMAPVPMAPMAEIGKRPSGIVPSNQFKPEPPGAVFCNVLCSPIEHKDYVLSGRGSRGLRPQRLNYPV